MYEQEITRRHRTAFIIAVDRSQSMCEEIVSNGRKVSKAVAVSEITSRIVSELIMRARREDGIHDYYDIALIGYSGDDVRSIIDPEREDYAVRLGTEWARFDYAGRRTEEFHEYTEDTTIKTH